MDFLTQVNKDLTFILSKDFATAITFTPVTGDAVIITGYATKHTIEVSAAGFMTVNSKKAHCTVTEAALVAAGFTTRDGSGNLITFAGVLVTYADVSGQTKTYKVQPGESAPDEGVGTIRFTLGNYTAS